MKVISESKSAFGGILPYIHLGYLSAAGVKPQGALSKTGIVLLAIVVPLTFFSLLSKKFRTVSKRGRFRMRSCIGAVLFISLACFVLSRIYATQEFLYPEGVTYYRMEPVSRDIISCWLAEQTGNYTDVENNEYIKAIPKEVGTYVVSELCVENLPDDWFEYYGSGDDAWGKEIVLEVKQVEDRLQYSLVSAGLDGFFSSEDDIVHKCN